MMWTLDKLESDFRDGYDEYLTRNTSASGNQAGRELPSGASPTQSDNGGRAGTELSKPVHDGLGQVSGQAGPQEVIGRIVGLRN